jgi:MFS family permease
MRAAHLRVRYAATASVFLVNGIMVGAWVARISAVAAQTGQDEGGMGFALLSPVIGAVLTMAALGYVGSKVGSHVTATLSTLACGLSLPLIGAAFDWPTLAGALFVFGVAQGTMDVSMNASGLALERAGAGPVMSRLHAMWSIGAFLGALVSTQCAALGIATQTEFIGLAAAVAVSAAIMWPTLIRDRHMGDGPAFRRPNRRLLLVGFLCACALLSETSATDWSSLYLSRDMGVDAAMAGIGVTVFTACMALVRIFGDHLTVRFGTARLVTSGSALAAVGLVLVLGPQILAVAVVGFALIGLGLATVVPSYFRAGGTQPGVSPAVGISAVSTMGYAGGMIGPPVVGTLGHALSLRVSLLILLGMMIILVVLSPRALRDVPAEDAA